MEEKFTSVKYDATREILWNDLCERSQELLNFIEKTFENGREKSLAITKLEEMNMWLGKALRAEIIIENNMRD